MKVVTEGCAGSVARFPTRTQVSISKRNCHIPQIHRAQVGLVQDMDYVADVLYERVRGISSQLHEFMRMYWNSGGIEIMKVSAAEELLPSLE